MWGAAVFFLTIMLVTATGRAVLSEFVGSILVAAQHPYSPVMLVVIGACAFFSMMLMCGGASKAGDARQIWLQVHDEDNTRDHPIQEKVSESSRMHASLRTICSRFLHAFRSVYRAIRGGSLTNR